MYVLYLSTALARQVLCSRLLCLLRLDRRGVLGKQRTTDCYHRGPYCVAVSYVFCTYCSYLG